MNETTGDVVGSKPEPKLSGEAAMKAVVEGMKLDTKIGDMLLGLELDPTDKKSHKRLIKAMAEVIAKRFDGVGGLKPGSISRQFSYGVSNAFPPAPYVPSASTDNENDGDESGDEYDTDSDD
jgi:hypothetical protein